MFRTWMAAYAAVHCSARRVSLVCFSPYRPGVSAFFAFFVSNTPQCASPQEHGVDVEYFVIFANVTDSNGMVAAFKNSRQVSRL